MQKKVLVIVGLIISLSTINVSLNSHNNKQSIISIANVEALTTESEWLDGMVTGTLYINGVTISCCVQSVYTNTCDFGRIGCATWTFD